MSEELKSFGSLLPLIYKDGAQPAVRSAGKALGSVAEVVFCPIERCAEIAKKNISKFFDKFDDEDQDNIVPPEPNIAVPILQKLTYTEDDDLVELYTELLKNGCLKNSKDSVLPSYINIISGLTPDEVRLIDYLSKEKYEVYLHPDLKPELPPEILAAHEYEKNIRGEFPFSYNKLPFFEIRDQYATKNEWVARIRYFTDITDRVNFQKPDNIELYLDNLKAAGVFEIREDIHMTPVEIYEHLENSAAILAHKADIEKKGNKMVLLRGTIEFTSLGISFLKSCTSANQQKD